ncbi:hypothetical protein EMIT048CA2_10280 [Pseudomonas chlororaphis]
MMGAAQGFEGSEFKHDRLLSGFVMGALIEPQNETGGLMAPIIHQPNIDKKRKKCRNPI